jgi:hypothetical protein
VLGVVLARFALPVFLADFPLEVDLVPHKHLDGIGGLVLLEHLIPKFQIVKGDLFGDIVHHHCAVCVLHIIRDEAAEPLLPCSIPKLDPKLPPVA